MIGGFYLGTRDLDIGQEHYVIYERPDGPDGSHDEVLASCGVVHPVTDFVKWKDCPVASRWTILRSR